MMSTLAFRSLCLSTCITLVGVCDAKDEENLSNGHNVKQKLNDTGITWSGHYPKGVSDKCEAKIVAEQLSDDQQVKGDVTQQQDCSQGRDARLSKKSSEGAAGFIFTKIDSKGKKLANKAKSWHCIKDEVSGLMWEVKQAEEGLHHSADLFTWYNSDSSANGSNIGDWNSRGKHCHGYVAGKPKTFCHVEQFVSRVNEQGLCGFNDWHLPTRAELTSLINYGQTEPAIVDAYFPETKSDFYWSSSAVANRVLEAWAVSFQFGFTSPMRKTDTRYARLVRTASK